MQRNDVEHMLEREADYLLGMALGLAVAGAGGALVDLAVVRLVGLWLGLVALFLLWLRRRMLTR